MSTPSTGSEAPVGDVGVSTGPDALREARSLLNWYVNNAKRSRLEYQVSEVVLLAAAAAVPVAGILTPDDARAAAIIGAVVVMLTGFRAVFHWHDNWLRFTGAGAALKSEIRLYQAGVPPYHDPATREAVLMDKVNATELTETSEWSSLSAPGAPPAPGESAMA
jgi:hypothetical protein